jgi:hypothetical protein
MPLRLEPFVVPVALVAVGRYLLIDRGQVRFFPMFEKMLEIWSRRNSIAMMTAMAMTAMIERVLDEPLTVVQHVLDQAPSWVEPQPVIHRGNPTRTVAARRALEMGAPGDGRQGRSPT